ncbi:hypothetical protein B0T16DRAFT_461198 [Cercophora newfieldiana]|uniref:Uncharacterized protein n=1 Tax=Cercophora newfieldiana TaxID=92897 RepID=A0AA40CJU9_9PEZI|nr:hypothetical protein B0T16DRAFT_461198 [Cercophora newfieldiana]
MGNIISTLILPAGIGLLVSTIPIFTLLYLRKQTRRRRMHHAGDEEDKVPLIEYPDMELQTITNDDSDEDQFFDAGCQRWDCPLCAFTETFEDVFGDGEVKEYAPSYPDKLPEVSLGLETETWTY